MLTKHCMVILILQILQAIDSRVNSRRLVSVSVIYLVIPTLQFTQYLVLNDKQKSIKGFYTLQIRSK